MDGRKNNTGTIGNKGGRKPKADEIKLIEQMDAVLVPETVWMALGEKVENGDTLAIKTWLSYRYGMPKQIVEQTNLNLEEKDLDEAEIQRIKKSLMNAY